MSAGEPEARRRSHGISRDHGTIKSLGFEYHCFLQHVREALLSSGGKLFGGSVLLGVLKHAALKSFYRYLDQHPHLRSRHTYEDPGVHPSSYQLRTTFPRDIDVFFDEEEDWHDAKAKIEDAAKQTRVFCRREEEKDDTPNAPYGPAKEFLEHFSRITARVVHRPLGAFHDETSVPRCEMSVKLDVIIRKSDEGFYPWTLSEHPNVWKQMVRTATTLEIPSLFDGETSPTGKALRMAEAFEKIEARVTTSKAQATGQGWQSICEAGDTRTYLRLIVKELEAGWVLTDCPLELSQEPGVCAYCDKDCAAGELQVKGHAFRAHTKCLAARLAEEHGQDGFAARPPPLPAPLPPLHLYNAS